MSINFLDEYLIEIDFPIEDLLLQHAPFLEKYFFDSRTNSRKGNNYLLPYNSFINIFLKEVEDKMKEIFHIDLRYVIEGSNYNPLNPYVYVQQPNNNYVTNNFHNHISTAYISSTTYLNIPNEGGEIGFLVGGNENPTIMKIKPRRNKMYFFPSWLYHTPYPHKGYQNRITINTDFESNIRISPKLGHIW
tara:strand:+ start:114 stop:683 length:570 start_codon:yes stop_codon:yes gene_type:complete